MLKIQGIPVTHYRAKGATFSPRASVWLQQTFPSIFGKAPPFDKGIALLVGVANYKHLPPLPNVRNDLSNMRDYLLVQEEFDDVYVLADEDVTARAINTLMFGHFAHKDAVGEQDRFLFYYSGHGSNETGVGQMEFSQANPVSYDADASLSVSNWRDWGNALKAKQALFLFDACALGAEIVSKGRSESDADLLRTLSQDKSRIAFAATRGGEEAHADKDTSYFTSEFLRVVQNAQADFDGVGFMTIAGIGDVMQSKLHEVAEQHGYKWYYTSPTGLDGVHYPGTFVFLNPKVRTDPESRFARLTGQSLSKGTETPSLAAVATPSIEEKARPTPQAAVKPSAQPTALVVVVIPSPSISSLGNATKDNPWVNSLGMKFVPVDGTHVLFSIWDTRVQDFEVFVKSTRYDAIGDWTNPGFNQGPTYPVVRVSWKDAKAFCDWLTKRERSARDLPKDREYRQPTDDEWSAAVGLKDEAGSTPEEKSGKIKLYPWDIPKKRNRSWPPPKDAGNYSGDIQGYKDDYVYTSPVGSFAANQFGLYDMGGNVNQWCEDWLNAQKEYRVLRGESWGGSDRDSLRAAFRNGYTPDMSNDKTGFRCVVAVESSQ